MFQCICYRYTPSLTHTLIPSYPPTIIIVLGIPWTVEPLSINSKMYNTVITAGSSLHCKLKLKCYKVDVSMMQNSQENIHFTSDITNHYIAYHFKVPYSCYGNYY